jgi:hypothetical protein
MKFLDKTIILKDSDNNSVCIFVDKIVSIKEIGSKSSVTQVNMINGVTHRFNNETICSFLRMIKMGCEGCDNV